MSPSGPRTATLVLPRAHLAQLTSPAFPLWMGVGLHDRLLGHVTEMLREHRGVPFSLLIFTLLVDPNFREKTIKIKMMSSFPQWKEQYPSLLIG